MKNNFKKGERSRQCCDRNLAKTPFTIFPDIQHGLLPDISMVETKVLKHSVVISGKTFNECKAEFDRICSGVKKDFSVECDLQNLIFSDMTERENECIAVFRIPED